MNLDAQPEVVRQFVLSLSSSPEGVVLESAGRPVVCVVPAPQAGPEGSAPEDDWTDEKNRRRCELLDQKYDRGLGLAEEAELALLQQTVSGLGDRATLELIDAADHSFHVPVKTGRKDADVLAETLDAAVAWMAIGATADGSGMQRSID